MILSRLRPLGLACGLLLAAGTALAANPDRPADSTPPKAEEADEADAEDAKAQDAAAEDKRICRYVKLDASSRRKTKVCRTTEEWRELGNPR